MRKTTLTASPHTLHQQRWLDTLDDYLRRHPERVGAAARFRDFMSAHADGADRRLVYGHLTGSAWLVSADGRRVLLTLHRKLGRWLQLGGHADGDPDLAAVALREAEEESGLVGLVVERDLFDIDRHWIPARGSEPGHWHYDLRYVVQAAVSEAFVVGDESHALAWRPIVSLVDDLEIDASIRRMAEYWLMRRPPKLV